MKYQKLVVSLLGLLAILLTAGLFVPHFPSSKPANKDALVELGFYLFDQPRQLAPLPLKTMAGEEVTLPKLKDQWQLVNFGYMFCPDICPINLRLMSELKQEWDSGENASEFAITHITFDPERDTPDRLSQYLDYINPDYSGLTGELDVIRKVAQQLNTVFIHEKPDEYGNYFITHSDSIALLNPAGEYVGLFKGPYDKENVTKALEILVN